MKRIGEVVGRLAGGEHGAVAVGDAEGTAWVLEVFHPDDERRIAGAIAVAATVRSRDRVSALGQPGEHLVFEQMEALPAHGRRDPTPSTGGTT